MRTFGKRAPFVESGGWFCAARVFWFLGKLSRGDGNRIVFGTCFPARWSGFVRTFWKRAPFVDKRAWFYSTRVFCFRESCLGGTESRIVFGTCFPARWSGFVRTVRNVARQINCHPEQVFDERSLFYRYAGDDFAVRGVAAVGVRFVDELGHADVVGVVVESRLEWNVDFVSAGDDFAHRVYP